MKSIVKSIALVLLALVVAAPLSAAEEKAPKKPAAKKEAAAKKNAGKRRQGNQLVNAKLKALAKVELTEEQTAAIKKLGAEYAPKIAAANKKAPVTKEQREARAAARKKAQADGLKGKKLQAAVAAAVELTDEQKASVAAANELRTAFNKATNELLTSEQRQKLRGGNKAGGAKKAKKDAAE